ncbi:hypothetical protein DL89DRAFT_114668 [Linderina pennispora]|uniref:Uncharacterized protein n=1 Tax=Linderina pennispora TaxID=61395 RepID=A0A1Y1VVU7_9FUNG|nr:uncharacterized protein DL89DRAFT_114668 [Linderina pennispora]ORX65417.1 hypothetical protein DL89DRAFT_114668 [Linderina pennispora]
MQDPASKIPLPRGSVFDRVKWIEKTHGASNPLADQINGGSRGKVKLPRASRVSERAVQINETNERIKEQESRIPKLSEISVLAGKPAAKLAVQPSPVISEASTIEVPPAVDTSAVISGAVLEQGAFSAPVMNSSLVHSRSQSNASSTTPVMPIESNASPGVESADENQQLPACGPPVSLQRMTIVDDSEDDNELSRLQPTQVMARGGADDKHPQRAATLPRSFTGSSSSAGRPSLGGVRGRAINTSRRYHKAPIAASQDEARPLSSSKSMSSLHHQSEPIGDYHEHERPSLLLRLNEISAQRPTKTDLVSNRSSPRFVKRSQFYSTTELSTTTTSMHRPTRRFK